MTDKRHHPRAKQLYVEATADSPSAPHWGDLSTNEQAVWLGKAMAEAENASRDHSTGGAGVAS
jgi:hypothetical protein